MEVLVIDGQGGKLGRELVEKILAAYPAVSLTAVGTNALAADNMRRGGARQVACGENAVIVNSRRADVIMGPIGIVLADALLGEISPAMAQAVGQSEALRILVPMNRCRTLIAGAPGLPTGVMLEDAVAKLGTLLAAPEKG